MFTSDVASLLINCDDLHDIFLQCAIYYAELGLNVWYISPQPFDHLPDNIKPPNKETLKLITFLYLKDKKDLLSHLNSIHNWHRCPELLILNCFDCYGTGSSTDIKLNLAFISATILDAMAVCARKCSNKKSLLIVGTNNNNLNPYFNMYFEKILNYSDKTEKNLIADIIKHFNETVK